MNLGTKNESEESLKNKTTTTIKTFIRITEGKRRKRKERKSKEKKTGLRRVSGAR
jgi:hypothetical protein